MQWVTPDYNACDLTHVSGECVTAARVRVGSWCASSARWMVKEATTAAGMGSGLNAPAFRPISTYRCFYLTIELDRMHSAFFS